MQEGENHSISVFRAQSIQRRRANIFIATTCIGMLVLLAFLGMQVEGAAPRTAKKEVRVEFARPALVRGHVLVTLTELRMGQKIDASVVRRDERALSEIPLGAVRDFSALNGLYARNVLPAGRVLTLSDASTEKPTVGVRSEIPSGFRAVSVSVDSLSSVEGWVRPGSRVDVSWTTQIRGEPSIVVILENLDVLSTERQTDAAKMAQAGGPVPSTVTLMLPDEDATKLMLAAGSGKLNLVLRGDRDTSLSGVGRVIGVSDLLGINNGPAKRLGVEVMAKVQIGQGLYEELVLLPNGKLQRRTVTSVQ